jgi:hypothetical protein
MRSGLTRRARPPSGDRGEWTTPFTASQRRSELGGAHDTALAGGLGPFLAPDDVGSAADSGQAGTDRRSGHRRRVMLETRWAGGIVARARVRPIGRRVLPLRTFRRARTCSTRERAADLAASARRLRFGTGRPRGVVRWRRPTMPVASSRVPVPAGRQASPSSLEPMARHWRPARTGREVSVRAIRPPRRRAPSCRAASGTTWRRSEPISASGPGTWASPCIRSTETWDVQPQSGSAISTGFVPSARTFAFEHLTVPRPSTSFRRALAGFPGRRPAADLALLDPGRRAVGGALPRGRDPARLDDPTPARQGRRLRRRRRDGPVRAPDRIVRRARRDQRRPFPWGNGPPDRFPIPLVPGSAVASGTRSSGRSRRNRLHDGLSRARCPVRSGESAWERPRRSGIPSNRWRSCPRHPDLRRPVERRSPPLPARRPPERFLPDRPDRLEIRGRRQRLRRIAPRRDLRQPLRDRPEPHPTPS